jgi:hypothetical protein
LSIHRRGSEGVGMSSIRNIQQFFKRQAAINRIL